MGFKQSPVPPFKHRSYCYTMKNNNAESSICADTLSPYQMSYEKCITAISQDVIALNREDLSIEKITIYDSEGTIQNVDIETNQHSFTIPNLEGEYIIQIDTNSAKGRAWYSLKIIITKED